LVIQEGIDMRPLTTRFRFAALAIAGAALTAPVAAHPDMQKSSNAANTQADMEAMANQMSDPKMQDGMADMVENMGEVMMKFPIGKMFKAIETARPGTVRDEMDDDTTLADLAGRDGEDMPKMLGKETRRAMSMMGGFTKAFATMIPEFEKMGRDMEKQMKDVLPNRN
jgi:hypothetical protein